MCFIMEVYSAIVQDSSIFTTDIMCTDRSIGILQDLRSTFATCITDLIEGITHLYVTLTTGHIDTTIDELMLLLERPIEMTEAIEGIKSIEMIKEYHVVTMVFAEMEEIMEEVTEE